MKKLIKVMFSTILAVMICTTLVPLAGATSYMFDSNSTTNEILDNLSIIQGKGYHLTLSYTFVTDPPAAGQQPDTFTYDFSTDSASYSSLGDYYYAVNYTTLAENASNVGISAPGSTTLNLDFTAANPYFYAYFFYGNINSDMTSTVNLDYSLSELPASPVPEPGTFIMLGGSILFLAGARRWLKR